MIAQSSRILAAGPKLWLAVVAPGTLLLAACDQPRGGASLEPCPARFAQVFEPYKVNEHLTFRLEDGADDGRARVTYVLTIHDGEAGRQVLQEASADGFHWRIVVKTQAGRGWTRFVFDRPPMPLEQAKSQFHQFCRSLPEGIELVGIAIEAGAHTRRIGHNPDA